VVSSVSWSRAFWTDVRVVDTLLRHRDRLLVLLLLHVGRAGGGWS
jgi:hypothetical protein